MKHVLAFLLAIIMTICVGCNSDAIDNRNDSNSSNSASYTEYNSSNRYDGNSSNSESYIDNNDTDINDNIIALNYAKTTEITDEEYWEQVQTFDTPKGVINWFREKMKNGAIELSDAEKHLLAKEGFTTRKYSINSLPIRYKGENTFVVYNNDERRFHIYGIEEGEEGYFGIQLHYDYLDDSSNGSGTIVYDGPRESAFYDTDSGVLERFQYGELISSTKLSTKAIYSGRNDALGYIFRVDDKVLTVNYDGEIQNLAENVQMVLVANYQNEEGCGVGPLLLMDDGSVRSMKLNELAPPSHDGGNPYDFVKDRRPW